MNISKILKKPVRAGIKADIEYFVDSYANSENYLFAVVENHCIIGDNEVIRNLLIEGFGKNDSADSASFYAVDWAENEYDCDYRGDDRQRSQGLKQTFYFNGVKFASGGKGGFKVYKRFNVTADKLYTFGDAFDRLIKLANGELEIHAISVQ